MKKYSTNYCSIGNNFIININYLSRKVKKHNIYSGICVVQNILHRGKPTTPSIYLRDMIKEYYVDRSLRYISLETPNWIETIKGYDENSDYPAIDFYYEILPVELSDLYFIRNLIIPEVEIKDILGHSTKEYDFDEVDFYFPQCRIVIEIDGKQHEEEINTLKDYERDILFKKNNIKVIRIPAKYIKDYLNGDKYNLQEKIKYLYNEAVKNKDILNYKKNIDTRINKNANKIEIYDGILRFQTLILELLKEGILDIEAEVWEFNVKNPEIEIPYTVALEDIMIWLKSIFKLQGIEVKGKNFIINKKEDLDSSDIGINIDFSLYKRWDDEIFSENICFIRNDYFDNENFFKVSTGELIEYKIITEGDDNNLDSLYFINKNIFGFDSFQNGQLPIIINSLMLKETIGLLPTGGGKSLCYQFCCLMQPTINFIVVPIKSLMYDQKLNLDKKGIMHTNYISSDLEASEKEKIMKEFGEGKYFYIWISPERFQIQSFRDELSKVNYTLNIGYSVIDEVHCLSEWGHDFRTSYLNLAKTIRGLCPSSVFLGLTATASKNVLKDILVEFEMTEENVKTIIDYTRKELVFKVIQDRDNKSKDKYENLLQILYSLDRKDEILTLRGNDSKCGLIFTPHANGKYGCYSLATSINNLKEFKDKVYFYSGDVPRVSKNPIMGEKEYSEFKKSIQNKFQNNEIPLLIATKAFGMGVDKGNVRYTIHYGAPASIESFYQEAGRAGRDKMPAICYLLHSRDKINQHEYDRIFGLDTTVEELREINERYKFPVGDILRNLFLAISSEKGTKEEALLTYKIYTNFCLSGRNIISLEDVKKMRISYKGNLVEISFMTVQKCIYRLSLLGIIDDWVIEDWGNRGKFRIFINDMNPNVVKDSLIRYINKYDVEFDFGNKKYNDYKKIIDREDVDLIYRCIYILIQWNYDNVFYSRRQSQKNLIDLCDEYFEKGEIYFKEKLEGYFKISDDTFVLDYLSNNPYDIEVLKNLIFEKDGVLKDKNELIKVKASLSRFLESFRYNTALNYLSGILSLVLDTKIEFQSEERFKSALELIKEKDEDYIENMLEITFKVGENLKYNNRDKLGEILCIYFTDYNLIYSKLMDNVSLNYILLKQIDRIKKVEEIIGG